MKKGNYIVRSRKIRKKERVRKRGNEIRTGIRTGTGGFIGKMI